MAQNSRFYVCVIARVSIEIYWFRDSFDDASFVGNIFFQQQVNQLTVKEKIESVIIPINSTPNNFEKTVR